MMRVSYGGELGWEIYTAPPTARPCGTCCGRWARTTTSSPRAGSRYSLQMEKAYRLPDGGTDVTAEHQPAAAGQDFAVRMAKTTSSARLPRAGPTAGQGPAQHRFSRSHRRGARQGAGLSRTTGRLHRLRHQAACRPPSGAPSPIVVAAGMAPDDVVAVDYRGSRYAATVHAEPGSDPEMTGSGDDPAAGPATDAERRLLHQPRGVAAEQSTSRGDVVLRRSFSGSRTAREFKKVQVGRESVLVIRGRDGCCGHSSTSAGTAAQLCTEARG